MKKVYRSITLASLCAGLSLSLNAQEITLNENCIISILNRTVQVAENGGWALPNVPSFMGRVRARANCVVDGQTITGESDFFL